MREKYSGLYNYMSMSKDPKNMKIFGHVMTVMMDDMIASNPQKAEEYIAKLESVKWKNYLTPSEADMVVAHMEPKAPWGRDQWMQAMEQSGFELEEWPRYNRCALYATMNMVMSDSGDTLKKYVEEENLFEIVYDLAVDKLTDEDGRFQVRSYFGL